MAWHVISSWQPLSVFSFSCKPSPLRFAPCENRQGPSGPNIPVRMRARLLQNPVDTLVEPRVPELGRALLEAHVDCLSLAFLPSPFSCLFSSVCLLPAASCCPPSASCLLPLAFCLLPSASACSTPFLFLLTLFCSSYSCLFPLRAPCCHVQCAVALRLLFGAAQVEASHGLRGRVEQVLR